MKRVLIITYYWPPAGGPGVQRVLNLAGQLPKYGWEVLVLTVENPSAPARDESLLSRIPQSCRVYKTKTCEPFTLYKVFTGRKSSDSIPKNISLGKQALSFSEKCSAWIRANLFIPDARKGWKPYMIRAAMRIIAEEKPQLIFSSSPPHSLQTGTAILARRSGLPWVADLRDPWSEAYWEQQMPKSKRSREKNRCLEEQVLNSADHITSVGKGVCELIKSKTKQPVSALYNGWRKIDNSPIVTDHFEIFHLGNLSKQQSVRGLLDALEMLDSEMRARIRLTFIGAVDLQWRQEMDARKGLEIQYHDFMPYEEMVQNARRASMLFMPPLESLYSKGLVSAKIFDYLALRRPIIAFTVEESDVAAILEDTKCGKAFESADLREASEYIRDCFKEWDSRGPLAFGDPLRMEKYSAEASAGKLAGIFDLLLKQDSAAEKGKENIPPGESKKESNFS